jgi:hypothetical protein
MRNFSESKPYYMAPMYNKYGCQYPLTPFNKLVSVSPIIWETFSMQGGNFFAISMKIQILYKKNPEAIIRGLSTVNALSISPTCTQHCLKKLLFLKNRKGKRGTCNKNCRRKPGKTISLWPLTKCYCRSKVGEVPTFRASDTDTDLPILSANLFHGFLYLKNRHRFKMKIYKRCNHFIALKKIYYVKVSL